MANKEKIMLYNAGVVGIQSTPTPPTALIASMPLKARAIRFPDGVGSLREPVPSEFPIT